MTIIKGSITHRKDRSNVESDLRIFNNKHLLISSLSNIGSISFFIEKITNLGRIFTKGITVIDVSDVVVSIGKKTHVLYNSDGFVYNDGVKGLAHAKDFTVVGEILIGNGGLNNEDFVISQLQFFDNSGDVLQQDVSYNYSNGGIISLSLHEKTIAHYPLTERYAFKADAAFILKHPQFIVGDNVFFDTVEQYNYVKVVPLSANHAKAINFTDDELGVINPSTQIVKKDFYNKDTLKPFGLSFEGGIAHQAARNIATPNPVNLGNYSNSIYSEFTIRSADGNERIIVDTLNFSAINDPFTRLRVVLSGGGYNLIVYLHSTFTQFHKITFNISGNNVLIFNKKYKLLVQFVDENLNNAIIHINNQPINIVNSTVGSSTLNDLIVNSICVGDSGNLGGNVSLDGIVFEVQLYDELISNSDRYNLFNNNITAPSLQERINFGKNYDGVLKTLAINPMILENLNALLVDTFFLEKETGLPEIKQSFDLSNIRSLQVENFNPTKEKGYTYIVGFSMNIDDDFTTKAGILYKRNNGYSQIKSIQGRNNFRQVSFFNDPNGVNTGDLSPLSGVNFITATEISGDRKAGAFGTVNNVDAKAPLLGWDEITDNRDLSIGWLDSVVVNGLDGSMFFLGVWKGVLSQKEIKRIVNNSLSANYLNDDCQLYLNFGEGNFSENGANVLIKDHSPQDRVCKVFGLNGGTTADQLLDVPNHLVNINRLR